MKLNWLNSVNDEQLMKALKKEERSLERLLNELRWRKENHYGGIEMTRDFVKYTYAFINTCRVIMKARGVAVPPKKEIEKKEVTTKYLILGY